MIGGLLKTTSVAALVAVAGVAAGAVSASAADFGGDCCADLEERVAELEATTARKGNRKVSLTIYGQVNTAVMFWDNGKESNAYVVDNDISSTRFGFKGKAKITPEWSAGYKIEIETESAASNAVDEANDDSNGINLRKAEWSLKSKTYGKVTVGQGGFANDGITHIDLSGTNVIAQFDDLKFGERLDPRSVTSAGGRGDYDDYTRGGPYEFNRGNRIRYDSPTFAGFIVSAAWGEDDAWDVALRYAGSFGDFKLAAGVAYGETTDGTGSLSNDNVCAGPPEGGDCENIDVVNGSASLLHNPTGLFVTAAFGYRVIENLTNADETNTTYAIRGGISQKFIPLGKTAFYGEYQLMENDDFRGALGVNSEAEIIGGGIVQKIDAAAMELYIGYRHVEVEDNVIGNSFDDLDVVTTGARIKF
ncbi:MAG: porin [Pseudomonadota bacterium]